MKDVDITFPMLNSDTLVARSGFLCLCLYLYGSATTQNDDITSYLLWQRVPVKIHIFNPYYADEWHDVIKHS